METNKKAILCAMVLLLLPVILHAQESREKDYEIALTKGQYEIELGNYSAAIPFLAHALTLKPKDQAASLSLGIAYSRSNDSVRAQEVLQLALAKNPSDTRVRYELALVLAKLGQQEEAKVQMAAVAKSNDPDLSAAAQSFLGEGGAERTKGFALTLAGGIQYDSNVILEEDDPAGPKAKKADWRAVLFLNSVYSFLNGTGARAEAGYQFYQSVHHDLSDYNVQQHTGRIAGRLGLSTTASAELEYAFQYSFAGADHYSTAHRFAPRLSVKLSPESLTELHASYELKRFFDSPVFTGLTGKNGTNMAAGVSHTIMLGKKAGIALDYTYDADSADAAYWSYTGNKGTVNALAEWGVYKFFGGISYYDRKYDAIGPGATVKRHDGVQEYSAGVSRKAGRTVTVNLSDQYTMNDSNLAVYQYKRNIISLTAEIGL
jgi:tetratricopeptide (TPR) repeat protein